MFLELQATTKSARLQSRGFISIPKLKACKHLHVIPVLQFEAQTNVLKSGFPAVHLVKPIRIQQGSIAKLF